MKTLFKGWSQKLPGSPLLTLGLFLLFYLSLSYAPLPTLDPVVSPAKVIPETPYLPSPQQDSVELSKLMGCIE